MNSKPAVPKRHRQRKAGAATVSIHVRDLAQMFNSFDPSPFWDRDLDREAAEFIEGEFSEKLSAQAWHLHVHAQEGAALAADLQHAVERYYERLAASARHRLREQMRLARWALLGGLAIFLASMTVRTILGRMLPEGAPRIIDEGFIIVAWLALWRPVESLVYGWVPQFRKRRLYERLAAIRVSVRTEAAHAEAAHSAPTRTSYGPSDSRAPPTEVSSPRSELRPAAERPAGTSHR